MRIHHIGIACKHIEQEIEAVKTVHEVIGQTAIITDSRQEARVCLLTMKTGLDIELIAGRPVEGLRQKGGRYAHLCYTVQDLDRSLARALAQGALLVSAARPAILFQGHRVAFVYFPYGLVELLEGFPKKVDYGC